MPTLAHKLRLVDYFVLAFGVMVGTAWLVVMDDILERGGPLGALVGFTIGALVLLPIGYVYGELVKAIPDAAGEAAYVARFFSPKISFVTGWMMLLSYFLTCPFEALAAGRILGYLFPQLNTAELYRLGGHPVYLPHLLVGLFITISLTYLNYRGIQASARLAKITTFTFLAMVTVFAMAGARHGSISNFRPIFSHAPLLSILLVWQVTPWLLGGFESVAKYVEEASPDFKSRRYFLAIVLTIMSGMLFFWMVIGAVAYVTSWPTLQNAQQFPTAVAFERALQAHWIVVLILGSAMLALLQAFNANMVASSRLLFAMGRRGLIHTKLSYVNPSSLAPSVAVVAVGIGSSIAMLLGDAGLVPILEVGALASSMAWMSACACCYRLNPSRRARAAAIFGLFITSLMVLVKVVPFIPGHFSLAEWISLTLWLALGMIVHRLPGQRSDVVATRTAAGSDIA